ncbi:unnamed protein product [Caenorhabditis auriculariae]|uniref:Nuclear receptor domain-containing protein n=1 Tax=Caenorhabditis auriculariae TaxID=2777116 RepID=A0A8S1H5Z5_9PELO|nr:unnamed protein product [Caenorhabditis auriculariae]
MSIKIRKGRKAEAGNCVICGENCLGKHYGITACLGCKTFFRRAVIQGQRDSCEKIGECNAISARKSCRGCRYRKCLDAGMTREALKPRRDLIGLGKVKKAKIVDVPSTSKEDPPSLIHQLTELDKRLRRKKYELIRQRQDMINMVDLLSMRKHDEENGPLRVTSARDLAYVLEIDLLIMLEWTRRLPVFDGMPVDDKMVLLKRFSQYYILLEHGRHTADSNVDDAWLISNGTCWPREVEKLPEKARKTISEDWKWRQEKLYRESTSVYIDEVSNPLRLLDLSWEEMAVLKIILLFPNAEIGLTSPTRARVDAFRDTVVHALFQKL